MIKICSDHSPKQNRVIVTGSTGFIGSYLVGVFLNQGVNVIALARSSNSDGIIARERVLKTLKLMHPKCDVSLLHVINANICDKHAGLTTQHINELKSTVDEIWHCAAITKFNTVNYNNIIETNVKGTINMIEVAKSLEVERFKFISTAYVYDRNKSIMSEELVSLENNFSNFYESSKCQAEHEVLRHSARADIRVTIFRLPVITGDSDTGAASTFRGYYDFVKNFYNLRKDIFTNFQKYQDFSHWGVKGIQIKQKKSLLFLHPAGVLSVPLHILCQPEASINLLPINIAVDAMIYSSRNDSKSQQILHITNGTPPTIRSVLEQTFNLLGVEGIKLIAKEDYSTSSKWTRLDREIARKIQLYKPYLFGEPQFKRDNLIKIIGKQNLPDFNINSAYLKKIIEFAIKHQWEK